MADLVHLGGSTFNFARKVWLRPQDLEEVVSGDALTGSMDIQTPLQTQGLDELCWSCHAHSHPVDAGESVVQASRHDAQGEDTSLPEGEKAKVAEGNFPF